MVLLWWIRPAQIALADTSVSGPQIIIGMLVTNVLAIVAASWALSAKLTTLTERVANLADTPARITKMEHALIRMTDDMEHHAGQLDALWAALRGETSEERFRHRKPDRAKTIREDHP